MNITAWSALSPFGHTSADFAAGVRDRRPTAAPVLGEDGQQGCLVPGFEPRTVLGKKGTRDMNRVTALAVTSVGAVLDGSADGGAGGGSTDGWGTDDRGTDTGLDTALVLGTTTGSVQSMTDFTRSSLTGERPYDVEPGVIPNSVMNCAAAQCAIRHRIQGPNTTLAGGRAAALLGLLYARRLLRAHRARTVLCGAAEEYSHARTWLEARSRGGSAPVLLGEGAAVLRLVPAELPTSTPSLATVLAVHTRHAPPGCDPTEALHTTLIETLSRARVAAADVWSATSSGLEATEDDALDALFPRQARDRLPALGPLIGDTGAAASALQIATVLAAAGQAPGGPAVITSVDGQGLVAAAVLRLGKAH
ncbi:3-oxoacyl-ACP synthase [Streptomyces sp. NBC_00237]|uniref:beta-ketoacyl synthase N-terminal-like domain-containing protein n=1 Tax=Streptomyces sp. NBC_00237 TaxID=2975687 RepID=UPI0022591218|nr:beta-ketoacyl synthase N-terminal-like domain-containing protein [Streptomyces sp. NBC_00237]MCX5202775.1 3-oxoacyl-ACP synthase [Streptomyces sp. NBC_00237]